MEIWRDIPGYIGLYQASSEGRIRSLCRVADDAVLSGMRIQKQILATNTANHGKRETVVLSRDGFAKRFQVHRLVLLAFTAPAPEGTECRHLDGDHLNNRPYNLEWNTHVVNMWDKVSHGTHLAGEGHPKAKLTENDVREIRASGKTGRELAAQYGVSQVAICHIRLRRTWKSVV